MGYTSGCGIPQGVLGWDTSGWVYLRVYYGGYPQGGYTSGCTMVGIPGCVYLRVYYGGIPGCERCVQRGIPRVRGGHNEARTTACSHHPFHCWASYEPPVPLPVSLLASNEAPREPPIHPFHCWSRYTQGGGILPPSTHQVPTRAYIRVYTASLTPGLACEQTVRHQRCQPMCSSVRVVEESRPEAQRGVHSSLRINP